MNAYQASSKLKRVLIVAAVAIAVASLWYTNALANRLMAQEREAIRLWAAAQAYVATAEAGNPHVATLERLRAALAADSAAHAALEWALRMPPTDEIDFVFSEIVLPERFSVPAVITDTARTTVVTARNVRVDSSRGPEHVRAALLRRAAQFDAVHPPLLLDLGPDLPPQLVHYGESDAVRALRVFPYVQLAVVALFVLVGYLGFAYVRRSEQSNLWVGMAKEAAHQLGTPLSSLLGWTELLRASEAPEAAAIADEIERDVARLGRVADRFQKIGSVPELTVQPLAPAVEATAEYVRRRLPQARHVVLSVDVPPDLRVALNRELFEWVVENLLKNALDAMEGRDGRITVRGFRRISARGRSLACLEVTDTGKGIERRAQRLVFRPGYSTKTRGWGLGLSLARRIVEDYHGGRLALVRSRPGAGTTFRITLEEAPS